MYIVNPIIFYLIRCMDMLYKINLVGLIIIPVVYCCILYVTDDDEDIKYFNKKYLKKFIIAEAICLLIIILIPDKETCIEMLVAHTVTSDKINWTIDMIKDLIDYIAKVVK